MSIAGIHLRLKNIEDNVSSSSTKLTREDVEETAKNVFDTLVSANEAKTAEELKTVTDKMLALDNELIAVKLSLLSIIPDEFAKKDDLSALIEKIDKIEKIVDKISSKQDIIIKRIVVLEKKADSP